MKKIILEERGYFWWHDTPIPSGRTISASPVSGLLRIDEEGRIELKLDAILPHPKGMLVAFSREDQEKIQAKRIQGVLKTGNKFVLLSEILMNGGNYPSNGIPYQEFLALGCLVGEPPIPNNSNLLQTRYLEIDLTGFEEWFRLGAIEVNRTSRTLSIRHRNSKDVSYRVEDGKITIKYGIYGPIWGKSNHKELKLKEKVSLVYTLAKNITISEAKTTFALLEDLFILLTGSDYCLDWPVISIGKANKYNLYFLRNKSSATAPDWHECWTNFIQLRDNFGEIFSTWKKKREIFGPGFYLYLGTRRGMQLYTENRFVNLVSGIESFHRRKIVGTLQPSALENKIQRILDQAGPVLDPKDKKWLAARLKNASEPSLQDRIFDTLNALPVDLNIELLAQFSKKSAERRNEIAHFGGQKHDEPYDDFLNDLNKRCAALSILYHVLILHEIGVDDQIISWWVNEGFRSYNIKKTLVDAGLLEKTALDEEMHLPELISNDGSKSGGAEPNKTTVLLRL